MKSEAIEQSVCGNSNIE